MELRQLQLGHQARLEPDRSHVVYLAHHARQRLGLDRRGRSSESSLGKPGFLYISSWTDGRRDGRSDEEEKRDDMAMAMKSNAENHRHAYYP
jgi:hypothetical protein